MWIGFAGELSFAQTLSKDSVVIHFPQGKGFDYRRLTHLVEIDSNRPHRKEVLKIFQDMVIKTNLPYYAFVVPNIAIERSCAAHWSVDIPLWYSPYTIARNYRFRILALQPSLRYWLRQSLQGHFLAVHALWGQFNISVNHQTRYQDFRGMWGGGIDYGYALRLKNRWGMEFNLGAGYIRTRYETYFNRKNGALYGKHLANYWGVTRLGISLTYKL